MLEEEKKQQIYQKRERELHTYAPIQKESVWMIRKQCDCDCSKKVHEKYIVLLYARVVVVGSIERASKVFTENIRVWMFEVEMNGRGERKVLNLSIEPQNPKCAEM